LIWNISTSSPESLPDLAQIILGQRGFYIVPMKGIALLQGEIIAKE
jgi:hypothetical protein